MKQVIFLVLLLSGLAHTLYSQSDLPDPDKLASLEGKKVLFIYGGWKGHQPDTFVALLHPWLTEMGAQVDTSKSLAPYADSTYMASVDLILQVYTMSKITKEQEKGMLRAVRNGTGVAGWHGGLCDAFRNNPAYQFMTGGQWVAHPGGKVSYSVQITNQEDAVTKGLEDFTVHTEQYYMHVDPNVEVLATTRFNGKHAYWIDGHEMPVTWKKMHGKGRVFYTSLGHSADVFDEPNAMKMLKRGIRWAAGSRP